MQLEVAKAKEFWADYKAFTSLAAVTFCLGLIAVAVKLIAGYKTYTAMLLAFIQWPFFAVVVPVAVVVLLVTCFFLGSVQLDRHRRALDEQGNGLLRAQSAQLDEAKQIVAAMSVLELARQLADQFRLVRNAEEQNFDLLRWYVQQQDPAAEAGRAIARDAEGDFRRTARRYQPGRLNELLGDSGIQLGCLAPAFPLQGLDQPVPHETQLPANVQAEYRRLFRLNEAVNRELERVEQELSRRATDAWAACKRVIA